MMSVGVTLVIMGLFEGMDRGDLVTGSVLVVLGLPLTVWLVRRWQASLIHE